MPLINCQNSVKTNMKNNEKSQLFDSFLFYTHKYYIL